MPPERLGWLSGTGWATGYSGGILSLILVLGLRAVFSLPVQQYPQSESAVVTITTVYYGADPDVVAGFITTPLEKVIAQANGIDYMTSTSRSAASVAELAVAKMVELDQGTGNLAGHVDTSRLFPVGHSAGGSAS